MRKNNKKAVSTIVATVLIILLTVTSIALLSRYLIPFTKTNLEKSSECLFYGNYFGFDETFENDGSIERYNCYKESTPAGTYKIATMIRTNGNATTDIKGFQIAYSNEVKSEGKQIDSSIYESSSTGGVYIYDSSSPVAESKLRIPSKGEAITYVFVSNTKYTHASVYPVTSTGRICSASDSIELYPCSGNILS